MKQFRHCRYPAGKIVLALAAMISATGCETTGYENDSIDVAEDGKQVQLGYSPYGNRFGQLGELFYDFDFENPVRNETGALYCADYENGSKKRTAEGNVVRSTCGLTFVSPRYAITAAHCVDDTSCGAKGRKFKVRQFNIEDVEWRAVQEAMMPSIDGSDANAAFENGWAQNWYMDAADGYEITFEDNDCEVVTLCHLDSSTDSDKNHGRRNASICKVGGTEFTTDMALVFCPHRPIGKYLEVADDNLVTKGKKVEAHWYHEVLDTPLAYSDADCRDIYRSNPGSTAAKQCPGIVAHYNSYTDGKKEENYHYLEFPGDRESQLFPLINIPYDADADGKENDPDDIYQTIRTVSKDGSYLSANVWGCHGMSGTGLLVKDSAGNRRLVGPTASIEGTSKLGTRLCEKSELSQGESWSDPLLNYPHPKYSRALAKWAVETDLKVSDIVAPVITALM